MRRNTLAIAHRHEGAACAATRAPTTVGGGIDERVRMIGVVSIAVGVAADAAEASCRAVDASGLVENVASSRTHRHKLRRCERGVRFLLRFSRESLGYFVAAR